MNIQKIQIRKKIYLNSIFGLLYQVLTVVCGFILPRLILTHYGSEVNGLISSITQFLGIITLASCGVDAVVRAALYKPLTEKNDLEISKIIKSSNVFFRKVALIMFSYSIVLAIIYPFITLQSFDYFYTFSLIIIIAISSFVQYFFGITYRLLLSADQNYFVILFIQIIFLILNTSLCVVLVLFDTPIHFVKLVSAFSFIIQPFIFAFIAKKYYKIDAKIEYTDDPIKQKWSGFSQHIASVVLSNTDVVVLTLLTDLIKVSIYNVYYLIVSGMKNLVDSITTGSQSFFGKIIARNEFDTLEKTFSFFEWLMHTVTTIAFTLTGILIVPFVSIYTKGITDTDYIVPVFAILITISQAIYCLRLPYNIIILSAGHFKQTQMSAIIEMIINIVLSIVLVFNFGLIGVAIGTIAAMLYRTCYFVYYLSKTYIKKCVYSFFRHIFVDLLIVLLMVFVNGFIKMSYNNFGEWILLALVNGVAIVFIAFVVNIVLYPKMVINLFKKMMLKFNRGKNI